MWFNGNAEIYRFQHIEVKSITSRINWGDSSTPFGPSQVISPLEFVYAAMRASITGPRLGLRGHLAGGALAVSALSYLSKWRPRAVYGPAFGDLFYHENARYLKDFVGSTVKGTVGAALTFLEMQSRGYPWFGHWEDCSNSESTKAHPDFVYASSLDVCLVDAKGSASSFWSVMDRVKGEWREQILANAHIPLAFGGTATEGRVIAATLSRSTGTGLISAYGRLPELVGPLKLPPAYLLPYNPAHFAVQRAHFISVFFLLGLNSLAFCLLNPSQQSRSRALTERDDALQAVQRFVDGHGVYVGPARLSFQAGSNTWTMRLYAREHVIRDASDHLLLDRPELVETPMVRQRPQADQIIVLEAENAPREVLVESADGVGAIFSRTATDGQS
ncbi:TPA: hypothetical protein QDC27_006951 [Burkholderia cepacia ATCC 25416]|uniref:hypothetical protein n=1 Tax=Burkholderia cepacia TaxID=292 RepID=UPI001CF17D3B|nr:hypothetical protein [Burkholderia cepacia]HDR9771433.1 hypothetical protein [Burkholderia cepacia ATCC 25416]MCA8081296.1 hypothetical protein [Burkholderia cepacia]HDR9779090.1 hypothetical protein [Burkholderia cepacia ATCC 25416]HDR9787237.1 hypothetical protein [Burkholderia cepacia ATCC 25416]HDR9795588.1 hypothetical protein [Burkholderia cepacia ATCC 25416]